MHSSGKSLSKKDVVGWVGMKDVKKSNVRVLYENNEECATRDILMNELLLYGLC